MTIDEDRLLELFRDQEERLVARFRGEFATKEDLNRFATKEDLDQFATKQDLEELPTKLHLERFATKDDLKAFATKQDFDDFRIEIRQTLETELAKGFGQITRHFDERFDRFEEKTDRRIDSLFNLLDGFTKRLDDDNGERAAMLSQQNRQGRWIGELAENTGTTLSAP